MRAALGLARCPATSYTCALIMCALVRMKPNERTKAIRTRKWSSLPGRLDAAVVGALDVVPQLFHPEAIVAWACDRGARLQRPGHRGRRGDGGAAGGRLAADPEGPADRERAGRGHPDGPVALNIVDITAPLEVFAQIGLVFLFFLAGLEIAFDARRGPSPRDRRRRVRGLDWAGARGGADLRRDRARGRAAAARDHAGGDVVRDRRRRAEGRRADRHAVRAARDRRSLACRLRHRDPAVAVLLVVGRELRDDAGAAGPVPGRRRRARRGHGRRARVARAGRRRGRLHGTSAQITVRIAFLLLALLVYLSRSSASRWCWGRSWRVRW